MQINSHWTITASTSWLASQPIVWPTTATAERDAANSTGCSFCCVRCSANYKLMTDSSCCELRSSGRVQTNQIDRISRQQHRSQVKRPAGAVHSKLLFRQVTDQRSAGSFGLCNRCAIYSLPNLLLLVAINARHESTRMDHHWSWVQVKLSARVVLHDSSR